tara:strand:- start:3306 stop:3896 length:591 start_codon:yes stop_codon:yes gene_type:complete
LLIQCSFDVHVPVPQAWELLTDIEDIAPCMPGAELVEVLDDSAYRGNVSVRLGPVALTFDGIARFEEMDSDAYRARVSAQGSDKKGRGGATADIAFQLEPIDQGTRVLIDTDLTLSGSVAQYGRGAGMINELASQLVGQFADSLHEKIAASSTSGEPSADHAPAPASPKPISGLTLVIRSIWAPFSRSLKGLFGRG